MGRVRFLNDQRSGKLGMRRDPGSCEHGDLAPFAADKYPSLALWLRGALSGQRTLGRLLEPTHRFDTHRDNLRGYVAFRVRVLRKMKRVKAFDGRSECSTLLRLRRSRSVPEFHMLAPDTACRE